MAANLTQAERERAKVVLAKSMARGRSQRESADLAGVSHTTAKAMIREPDFQALLDAERLALVEAADPVAVRVLEELLSDPDPRIRLQAAVALVRTVPEHQPEGTPVQTVSFQLPPDVYIEPTLGVARRRGDPEDSDPHAGNQAAATIREHDEPADLQAGNA